MTKWTVNARLNWNKQTTTRIQATSNVLAQCKDIKMLGLGSNIARHLQEQFEEENRVTLKDRNFFITSMTLAACADSITPVLVIAGTVFWTRSSEVLTSSQFFATLAFVKLVSGPLGVFIEFFPIWATGFASLKRIQDYLALPEQEDARFLTSAFDAAHEDNLTSTLMADAHSSSFEMRRLEKSSLETAWTSGNGKPQSIVVKAAETALSPAISSRQDLPVPGSFLVKMAGVSITTASGEYILQNVSLKMGMGKLAMLIGPVGCGKSTFLRALLGEMKPSAGQITMISKVIAYCSQKPWIRNMSLQNNVIGKQVYDVAKYNRVIYICALDVDFAQLPDGDQSMAGTDGCNLSGGQKARLALARALYLDGDLLLLDDVFSALDGNTSAIVRNRLFGADGKGSPRSMTIIMVTNATGHLKDADVVYQMDQNGHIEETTWSSRDTPSDSIEAQDSGDESALQTIDLPVVKPSTEKESIDDKADTRSGDFSLYSYFIGPAGLPFILLESFFLIMGAIGERMPQIFGRIWMDNNPASHLYFIGFAVFGLANPLLHIAAIGGWFYMVNSTASNALHWRITETAMQATFEYLMAEDANFLLNRFSTDMSMTTQTLAMVICSTTWCGLMVLIDVGVIASGASYAAPIIPGFLLVVYLVQRFYLRTSRQLRSMELDNAKLLTRHLTETSTGIEHVRAFGWADAFVEDFHAIVDLTLKPVFYLYTIQQWLRSVMDLTSAVCAVSMVAIALRFKSSATPASIGLALLSLITFSETAALFIRFYVNMEMAFGAVARIRGFTQSTPVETDEDGSEVPEDWPRTGSLEMNGVTAVYK